MRQLQRQLGAADATKVNDYLKGGRHLVFPEHTPLTNLHLTMLNLLGVPTDKLGDSTGQFKELSGI